MPQIRLYTQDDFERIIDLFLLNTPQYFCPPEQQDLEHFLKEEEEANTYFVLENNGVIEAAAGYVIEETTGHLTWFIVHPEQQGKGLGSRLIQHHLEVMQNKGIRHIEVRTSQLVYPFYERFGFVLTSTEDNYWGPGMHLYCMKLTHDDRD